MGTRTISTKLAIEGEAEYKAKLKNINAELSLHKSELEKVQAQHKDTANSLAALSDKQSALKGQIAALCDKYNEQAAMLGKAQEAQQKFAAQAEELRAKLAELQSSSADTAEEEKKLADELNKAEENTQKAANSVTFYQKQLNITERDQYKLTVELGRTEQYLDEAKASADGCAHSIDQYGKEVKKAGKSAGEFAEGAEKSKVGIEQLAAALAAAGVAKTVKEIADELMACAAAAGSFETAMAKVSTLAGPENLEGMKAQLVELSNETGVAASSLAEAAYQAMSAGVDAADAVEFVTTATKTSVAGFTDSATAVDVLTTALNAYKLEGDQAERVASMLVKTQDEGKTSVGELAQNMGRVIPVAAAYNVSLENLTTSYALLTKNGTNTAITTTNITAMLTELAKDGSTVADVLKNQTGKSFAELSDSGQNLGEIMEILAESVGGDATAFSNLWSSTTAGQAALSLLNSGAEEFDRTLEVMANSSGAVERNFQVMADTSEQAHQRMATAAENLRIAIGDRLNPALENLYDVGADAFTWATDFVNENPEIVGALTAVTVGMGVLAAGVTLAANAENIMAIATGALNAVMSANPAYLVAAGIAALVTAIGTYIATAESSTDETREFTKSLQESKAAYDDLMSSMHQQQADTDALAASLETLLAVENKSTAQKDTVKKLVDQLNEAIPGLGLAYDAEKDALVDLTEEELKSVLQRAKAQEEYEAKQDRLAELRVEQAEIAERRKQAEEELAEAEAKAAVAGEGSAAAGTAVASSYAAAAGAMAQTASASDQAASSYAAASGMYTDTAAVVSGLKEDVDDLTAAEEDNAAQIAALEAETEAYAQQQVDAEQKTKEMTATMDGLVAEMSELEAAYTESYNSAYESISSQLGLFNELDGTAKTTIDDLIGTLEGQVEYMEDYAANMQKAMEMGVNEGLLRKLSDGSEESAQILDAIVKGGEDKVAELNEQFAKVEDGKEQFSNTVAQMETDFDEKMAEVVEDLNSAIEEMDLEDAAYEIGQNNVQGLIDGTADPSLRQALVEEYTAMAKAALEAYKAEVQQHSPSKKFAEAGNYDIQGLIEGAEAKKAELAAAYEDMARMSLEGYADGVTKNLDKVERALDELEAAFKRFDSYYSAKSEVSGLEYELWERTDGRGVPDMMKYQKKLEMLTAQQEDQAAVVKEAQAAYEAVVEQYGAASEESYRFQKTLLEEKLAYQDLLDTITQVTNAKHKAFIEQEAQRFADPLPYSDPYQASAATGSRLVAPDGLEFAAAYEDAAQRMLTASATHLPSSLEEPTASQSLERQLGAFTAATVNAIAGSMRGGFAERTTVKVVTLDGKTLASATFDDFVDYADANGTPILNSRR